MSMNKSIHTIFSVSGDTQVCVRPYKASNRQPNHFFGVLYLCDWLLPGMNKPNRTRIQVMCDTHAFIIPNESSKIHSSTCLEYFVYLIEYLWEGIKEASCSFMWLVTHMHGVCHINNPIESPSIFLDYLVYDIDYWWALITSTTHFSKCLVTHRHVLYHINHPIDSPSTCLEYFVYFIYY